MTRDRLAEWKAYYTDLQTYCDVHDDYQHILDIIAALESAWATNNGLQLSYRNACIQIEKLKAKINED